MIEAIKNKYISKKQFKILNFYSDWCPPCHAFMPNFIEAEKTFWKYFDFIIVNVWNNINLASSFRVMWTPTIIILDWEKIIFNQSWVPNWWELKKIMTDLIWKDNIINEEKIIVPKKKFLGLF